MANKNIKNIAVFCGAKLGNNNKYATAIALLADKLAQHNLTLVYGATNIGLMGILADQMLKNNGKIIGITTEEFIKAKIIHPQLNKLHVVKTISECKKLMFELADAFILFPGSTGSLDEFIEIYVCAQLGYHHKPISIFNVNNYYNHLLKFFDTCLEEGFMTTEEKQILITANNIEDLFQKILLANK